MSPLGFWLLLILIAYLLRVLVVSERKHRRLVDRENDLNERAIRNLRREMRDL
jgi:hypothetical protein